MTPGQVRFPAEWEPQSAVLLAWPHAGTDWADRLGEIEDSYVALVAAIARFQPAIVCIADADVEAYARARLASARIDMDRVHFVEVEYDDTWLRDTGPVTLSEGALSEDGGFRLLDFRFTGWGGKFGAERDDRLVAQLHASGIFGSNVVQSIDFALEGGAIETDGSGTLLSTLHCLQERHPTLSEAELEARLGEWLGQDRFLWLRHGYLEGDDTDAHIDTLARFAAPDAIVYQACDDPADGHFAELQAMAQELAAMRTRDGAPYRLFALPWPSPVLDGERRLPASYANFLILNDAVLVPAYDDPADPAAAAVLAEAFPGREIVPVPARALVWQNGSIHCLTMQMPEGSVDL